MGVVADPKIGYTPLPTCYHVKFGSFATNGLRINRKQPQIGERWDPALWGGGVADNLKTIPSPYVLPREIL